MRKIVMAMFVAALLVVSAVGVTYAGSDRGLSPAASERGW